MNKLFLTCKLATEYIEKNQEGQLGFVKQIQLKIHLTMCSVCKAYKKQSAFLTKLFQKNHTKIKPLQNPDLKEKIKVELSKKIHTKF